MTQVCRPVQVQIEKIVFAIIETIEAVVTVVCTAVTSIIRTIRKVIEKICSWVPWPLNALCKFVTKTLEFIEKVIEWVCKEIIQRIIRYVTIAVRYVFWILRWVCWAVDQGPRYILEVLPCLMGHNPRKKIPVSVKILVDETNNPVMTHAEFSNLFQRSKTVLEECNVELCISSIDFVEAPSDITDYKCTFWANGFLSKYHLWLEENQSKQPDVGVTRITVFVIPKFDAVKVGCVTPRTDYMVIGANASFNTITHELGHQADLSHVDDPNNIMFKSTSADAANFTRLQCCIMRSARFCTSNSVHGCMGGVPIQW